MKIYTADSDVVDSDDCKSDPVASWLSQFVYGYTDDVYPLFENTQDNKFKEILQYADFVVVTQSALYKRHILNEGGFMWPSRAEDNWFVELHSGKERWNYLKNAVQAIPRLKLPPYGTVRVRYKGMDPMSVYWKNGYYVAENEGGIVRYEEMTRKDFEQHIAALRDKGQVF